MRVALLIAIVMLAASGAMGQTPTAPSAAVPISLEPRPCPLLALRFIQPRMVPGLVRSLNLTDVQKTQVTDLLAKAEEALKPKIDAQREAAKLFAVAMSNPDVDQALLTSLVEKAVKAEAAVAEEKIKTLFALRALLTDEQKIEFNKVIEQRTDPWRRDGFGAPAPMPRPSPPPPAGEAKPPAPAP